MKRTLMLMGLCALLVHTSCKSKKEEKEAETKLLVTCPLKTDTSVVNQYVCQIRSVRHIDLRAQEKRLPAKDLRRRRTIRKRRPDVVPDHAYTVPGGLPESTGGG